MTHTHKQTNIAHKYISHDLPSHSPCPSRRRGLQLPPVPGAATPRPPAAEERGPPHPAGPLHRQDRGAARGQAGTPRAAGGVQAADTVPVERQASVDAADHAACRRNHDRVRLRRAGAGGEVPLQSGRSRGRGGGLRMLAARQCHGSPAHHAGDQDTRGQCQVGGE